MVFFVFLLATLIALILFVSSLSSKRFKKSAIFFLLLIGCLIGSIVTSRLGQAVLSVKALTYQVSGDAMNGLEAYEQTMNIKCKGLILDQCSKSSLSVESVQKCLYSKFPELSGECALFLSNTPLVYPPLSEDKVIEGISFPKGTVVHMSKGYVTSAITPQPWQFSNKNCAAGQVMFSHWESRIEDKIKVSHCREK